MTTRSPDAPKEPQTPVSEQVASPATRSAAAIPSNIRRTLEESNLPIEVATAIADRLDAPCEEVEKRQFVACEPPQLVVPADYARDLYRKWREANRRAEYWKAEHLAGNKALEAAERSAAEAVARLREDAERLEFVVGCSRPMGLDIDGLHYWQTMYPRNVRGPNLREAIDAARREKT